MTTLEAAPDLEDLAAYVDGRLSGDRKARVEEHLLHDEDYYEVFMETVRFQEEQDQEERRDGGKVVPWPGRRVIAPLAAAAILVVSLITYRFVEPQQPGDLVAELNSGAIVEVEAWGRPGWRTWRGGDGPTKDQVVAYCIGIRSIDLKVALTGQDLYKAGDFAGELESYTGKDSPLEFFLPISDYETLVDRLLEARDNPATTDFAALLSTAELAEGRLLPDEIYPKLRPFMDMGRWAEIGRLAAISQNHSVLRDAAKKAQTWKITSISQQVATLRTLRKRRTLSPADFETARTAFSDITRAITDNRIE